jgi:hypothetical protein
MSLGNKPTEKGKASPAIAKFIRPLRKNDLPCLEIMP